MKFKTLVTSIALFFTFTSFAGTGFMPVATVAKMNGTILANNEKLHVNSEISEGMELIIPKKGDFVEIKFQNGHLVRFVGAKVKVETLNPKNTFFNLISGKIFSAIKPLTKNETFQVKTKRVSFAVRGTKFMVEESKKQSYICVCEGVVAAKSAKGEVEVRKDEDLTLAHAKDELKSTLAAKKMVDMTNAVFTEMGVN